MRTTVVQGNVIVSSYVLIENDPPQILKYIKKFLIIAKRVKIDMPSS